MTAPRDFTIHLEDERIRVRFVSNRVLGNLASGHHVGGDYQDNTIRLFRNELRKSQRTTLLHELGHHLVKRQELRAGRATEEDICDLFTWLPAIFSDERNGPLLAFLGLKRGKQ